jgi:hypothetical protein
MSPTLAKKIVFRDTHAELIRQVLAEPGENQVLTKSHLSMLSPGTEKAALTRVWDDPICWE